MSVPDTYISTSEAEPCGVPNVAAWNEQEITFDNKLFIRHYSRSIFYIPLRMATVMSKLHKLAADANADMPLTQTMTLSRDLSPWRSEQLYAVTHTVDGADNVALNGTFLCKVFDEPFNEANLWRKQLRELAKRQHKTASNVYFFYTTSPQCTKQNGNTIVIGLAQEGT